MQSYPLQLAPAKTSTVINVEANLFVYESNSTAAGDPRILVKPDNGEEITLRPGQRFRITGRARAWTVKLADITATIAGSIIIGSGEFSDSNTKNTVTLDASFANNVTVMNDTTKRVPVTLDVTQTIGITGQVEIANDTGNQIPVKLDTGTQRIFGGIVEYTDTYSSAAAFTGGGGAVAINIMTAARNTNGAILSKFEMIAGSGVGVFAVLAKATAPTSVVDGDVLFSGLLAATAQKFAMDQAKDGKVVVPAGKGIWYFASISDSASLRSALVNVLP